jgi:hypothetical protein
MLQEPIYKFLLHFSDESSWGLKNFQKEFEYKEYTNLLTEDIMNNVILFLHLLISSLIQKKHMKIDFCQELVKIPCHSSESIFGFVIKDYLKFNFLRILILPICRIFAS